MKPHIWVPRQRWKCVEWLEQYYRNRFTRRQITHDGSRYRSLRELQGWIRAVRERQLVQCRQISF